jgi:hypothetical protein
LYPHIAVIPGVARPVDDLPAEDEHIIVVTTELAG